jgi:crotonobetainyl-CoA:carnitine CoA-transferase CaiB-like acyl-CoA transferase
MRPLDGISVLDVTQMISGPFASMQLADLGADVVKIERPDGGELGRSNPPFVGGRSTYFASVNRNKRSVALDLSSDPGRDAFLSLAEVADVVVENNPPGRMARFGLDYESVRERNPEVVYCSISGFGQDGPYRELPALDLVAQAMSGVTSITGPADDQPYRAGLPIADLTASMFAVQSVVLALFRRERTGEGDRIDVSMLDCLASWLTVRAGHSFGTGEPYPRMGNAVDEFVPYDIYETADGYLAVAVVADHQWRRLCRALDLDEYAEDDRCDPRDRVRGRRRDGVVRPSTWGGGSDRSSLRHARGVGGRAGPVTRAPHHSHGRRPEGAGHPTPRRVREHRPGATRGCPRPRRAHPGDAHGCGRSRSGRGRARRGHRAARPRTRDGVTESGSQVVTRLPFEIRSSASA